jgi:hypothetical protein
MRTWRYLILPAVLGLAAGCSSSPSSTPAAPPSGDQEIQPPPPPGGPGGPGAGTSGNGQVKGKGGKPLPEAPPPVPKLE